MRTLGRKTEKGMEREREREGGEERKRTKKTGWYEIVEKSDFWKRSTR